ncbi:putative ATP-dependent helicase HrpB [Magnetofaba australis IT-1]|uniref:Putative ATP-dependent helicase HrpB n=1 Tax=Magnetofaba australis IT-1 TaxID=1434232 RepID=A0A1Y2K4Z0_9PROT|nr:putative ATP-dependent helicase HrpB [Magnetofaba australis IT-1]
MSPIVDALGAHPNAVITAPPGSGKTTALPLALLDAPWLGEARILMLEPRRVAARAAAARMAHLLGESVGDTVGYQVRFERKRSARTRLEVVTEGILTRRLQSDPELSGVGVVIFDEFHERALNADLGLALCLELQSLRDDLRLLVLSATIDPAPVSKLLGDAPVLDAPGRIFPVQTHYLTREDDASVAARVAAGVKQALREAEGDILAFLPGAREIRAAQRLLDALPSEIAVLPLYGDLGRAEQDRALAPADHAGRRVILATDIAETSLTIPGVAIVVDGGHCRRPRFHPPSGLTRLETLRISRHSADQRAGRAGRTGPGVCYRMWRESTQRGLTESAAPEMLEADLAPLLLELALWGAPDPQQLPWLTPPPEGACAQARDLLVRLDAIDDAGRITEIGRRMAELPLHPRLAHMILTARDDAERALACDLAALLGEHDPLRDAGADVAARLNALAALRSGTARGPALDALRHWQRAAQAVRRIADVAADVPGDGDAGALLCAAFPDRIGQQRTGQRGVYLLANGRAANLRDSDALAGSPYVAAAHLDAGERQGRIFLAAHLDEATLRQRMAAEITQADEIAWESRLGRVVAMRRTRLGALVLEETQIPRPDAEAVRAALLAGLRQLGVQALPWSKAAQQLRARVGLMRRLFPEESDSWPDLSDAALWADLDNWLGPFLTGITRREQFSSIPVMEALMARIDWSMQQKLEARLPTHWRAPSGSNLPLDYAAGAEPMLRARVQEMFGVSETPRLAEGRLGMVLELLSPAQRPLQITADLGGYWAGAWAETRKEMQGRYPKHYWPEDPANAQATNRAKPRKP